MKRKLTKAEYEALTDAMKLMYVADGDGYKLPLVDDDDPDALRRALVREREEKKAAKDALAAAQAKIDEAAVEGGRKTGDITVIENSWREKLAAAELASKATVDKLTSQLHTVLIDHAATSAAAAITSTPGNAALMLPHITSRFEVVMDGDTPVVKIKDSTGRLSAMSMEEFQKELVATPKFSSIVVGSRASGAGGSGGSSKSGGAGGASGDKKFAEMTGAERTALYQSDRASFDRQAAEHKAEQQAAKFNIRPLRITPA